MRERLTAAFVAIAILTLVLAGVIRSYIVSGELRERDRDFATSQARLIGQVIGARTARGDTVDEDLLARFVLPGSQVRYEHRDAPDLVLTGADFTGVGDDDTVSGTVVIGDETLTITRVAAEPVRTLWRGNLPGTVGLFALIGLVAGLVGYVVARALSEPFRQLAVAAAALGRGRFDLDLPTTRVPEARAIGQALESSATQLRERLEREREFGLLASHVLRTPLTSLRLNLEELVEDPTVPEDARQTAMSCLTTVGRIADVAGELVEVSGRGVLVAGAAIPLRLLATQVSQRWAELLEDQRRELTAAVEGDLELLLTPGPIDQVLDLILDEVLGDYPGAVRLVFEGQPTTVAVDITCEDRQGRVVAPRAPARDRTAAVLSALGGLIEAPEGGPALRVLLPRR